MRVLIAGGGTGGHLFPGIAVAQELVRRCGAEVRFMGSTHGIERTAVPRAGFPVELLPVRGLRGEGMRGAARLASSGPRSVAMAIRSLRRQRPNLTIGVGGYAAFPPVVASALLRVPIVLLEQNAIPGLTTRVLAPLAKTVCLSFPSSAATASLRARTVVTGNPVRFDAASQGEPPPRESGDGRLRVLVFGGSAGARRLNSVVPGGLAAAETPLSIVHQTGAAERDAVDYAYKNLGLPADVRAFIDDMVVEYRRADLVICRAGATTLAELTALGVAAMLVPYPFAAGDHQRRNAEALVDAGAAWMILDQELDSQGVARHVRQAAQDAGLLERMRAAARALGRPDAATRVADECLAVATKEAA